MATVVQPMYATRREHARTQHQSRDVVEMVFARLANRIRAVAIVDPLPWQLLSVLGHVSRQMKLSLMSMQPMIL